MRSGYEYLEKMQLNEDEDGKDWMYTSSDMIRETDCTEGIEMNDKMNEICEELFDYKYRDNEKLDIVEGWFICMK